MHIGSFVRRSVPAIVAALAITLWSGVASAAPAGGGNGHSPNFAGYQVNVVPTKASTGFKLPSLTCTSTNAGIVPTLVFTNFTSNEFTSGGVYVECVNGQPGYASLVEINDRFSFLTQTLNAGDVIKISISVSSNATTVTIKDVTARSSVKDTVSGPGGGGSFTGLSVGDNTIGSPPLPVAQFPKLTFSGTTVNGASLGSAGTLFASDMYNGPTLQIKTGRLSSAGTGFATTFVHT